MSTTSTPAPVFAAPAEFPRAVFDTVRAGEWTTPAQLVAATDAALRIAFGMNEGEVTMLAPGETPDAALARWSLADVTRLRAWCAVWEHVGAVEDGEGDEFRVARAELEDAPAPLVVTAPRALAGDLPGARLVDGSPDLVAFGPDLGDLLRELTEPLADKLSEAVPATSYELAVAAFAHERAMTPEAWEAEAAGAPWVPPVDEPADASVAGNLEVVLEEEARTVAERTAAGYVLTLRTRREARLLARAVAAFAAELDKEAKRLRGLGYNEHAQTLGDDAFTLEAGIGDALREQLALALRADEPANERAGGDDADA